VEIYIKFQKNHISFIGRIHNDIYPYKCLITPTNTTNIPTTNKNPSHPPNDFIKTPERSSYFSKRSFSESIKTEKPRFFEDKSEDLVKINSNDSSSFETTNKNSSFSCKTHNEEFSLFCVTEKETLCPSCVYTVQDKHKTHNIIPLKQAYAMIKKDIEKFRGFAREKLLKIEDSIKISMKNVTIIEKNLIDFTKEIEREFGLIRKSLEIKEDELKMKIKEICFEKNSGFEKKIKDLTFLQDCLKDYKNFDKNSETLDQRNFIYIYNVNNLLKKTLANIDFNYKVLNSHEVDKMDFSNKKKVLKEIENFGKILQNKVEISTGQSFNKTMNNISNSMRMDFSVYEKNWEGGNNSFENMLNEEEIAGGKRPCGHKRAKTECIGGKYGK